MGRGASAAVALIIGTVEISDLRVSLIEVEMQVVSAIGTDQQAGKHILLALVGSALADFAPFLLNLLPHGAINNRLMDIFENHPIFTVVFDSLLIFVRLGVGLKIEDTFTSRTGATAHCRAGTIHTSTWTASTCAATGAESTKMLLFWWRSP